MPTIEILQQTNPAFDRDRLLDCVALYRGGKCFSERKHRFLPKNEFESEPRYQTRLATAKYFNYIGPIVDRFAAALIQAPPSIANTNGKIDDFWQEWQGDVDGAGTDFSEFARESFTDALMKHRTFFLVEKPRGEADTLADWEAKGLGKITVRELETQDVIDWDCDPFGRLRWLTHYGIKCPRPSPLEKRNRVVETWTIYDQSLVSVYSIEYEKGNRPDVTTEVPLVEQYAHGLNQVPVVVFEVPEGMALVERAFDAQVEHFVERAALSWALAASCYAMPLFNIEDPETPPKMGVGYAITLGANDKASFLAPPSQPFEVVAESVNSCREEIYRIVHQMAEGISSKASATARSGDSKKADMVSTNTILEVYAVVLRDALLRVIDIACALRGENSLGYSVSGLDQFAQLELTDVLDSVEKANRIEMPSPTFQLKVREMILSTLMPQLPEVERAQIVDELSRGIAHLKDRDDLEAKYQQALAHALNHDSAKERPGNTAGDARGDSGGNVVDAPKEKANTT